MRKKTVLALVIGGVAASAAALMAAAGPIPISADEVIGADSRLPIYRGNVRATVPSAMGLTVRPGTNEATLQTLYGTPVGRVPLDAGHLRIQTGNAKTWRFADRQGKGLTVSNPARRSVIVINQTDEPVEVRSLGKGRSGRTAAPPIRLPKYSWSVVKGVAFPLSLRAIARTNVAETYVEGPRGGVREEAYVAPATGKEGDVDLVITHSGLPLTVIVSAGKTVVRPGYAPTSTTFTGR